MTKKADQLKDRMAILEAERLILTIELRNELTRAARELLPEAIRQAKPQRARGRRANRKHALAAPHFYASSPASPCVQCKSKSSD